MDTMKMIIVFIIVLDASCYASGSRQDLLHDRYSQDISKITERYYNNLIKESDKLSRITIKDYNEIKNGLYIIGQTHKLIYYGKTNDSSTMSICYNINHMNQISNSEIRFVEILNIVYNNL